MEEPKDKRTKAYKEWVENYKDATSTGLGDVIEKVTKSTGIKKAVEFIDGEDCGCDKRKEKANKIKFRFQPLRCFTEEQYNAWGEFMNRENKNIITHQQQVELLIPIYAQLFARQLKPMTCCVQPYVDDVNRIYELYN